MIGFERKKTLAAIAVMCAALLLFLGYSFLALSSPGMDASPDERANRIFSGVFSEEQRLYIVDPLNTRIADPIVHGRSMRVVDGLTVPGSFVGLPLAYGVAGTIFGTRVLPFLTPFIAVLGVLAWGALVGHIYGRRVGAAAALLLATHTAWWYWSARTFMPNVPFLSFAIIGAWFAIASPMRRWLARAGSPEHRLAGLADCAIAGVMFGLALGIRLSEAYWIAVGLAAGLIAARKFPLKRLVLIAAFASMTLGPMFITNHSLYGNMFAAGYSGAPEAISEAANGGIGAQLLGPVAPVLFPLGFAPRTAFSHFASFGIGLLWQWSLLVILAGIVLAVFAWRVRRSTSFDAVPADLAVRRAFLWGGLAAAAWLIVFYGSWTVRDNPDPDAVTIGASYVRYWLPLFALSTIPVALAVVRLRATASRPLALLGAAMLVFAAVNGPVSAFRAPQEGLDRVREVLASDRSVRDDIVAMTEQDAVIVVDRADKFLFPQRRVIVPLRSEHTYAALPSVFRAAPVYYFGITFPDTDLAWLNEVKLPPLGLRISPVKAYGDNTLYVFMRAETSNE
jgi:hypothetical protein